MLNYSKLTILVALATPLVKSQIASLPACASNITAINGAFKPAGCSVTDVRCICSDSSFFTTLEPIVQAACGATDLATTLAFVQNLCQSVGVTLSLGASIPPTSSTSVPPTSSTSISPASITDLRIAGTGTSYTSATVPATISTYTYSSMPTASILSDSQPQIAATGPVISELSDGQPLVTAALVISQLSDGQPQAPTGASYNTTNVSTTSATSTPAATIVPFEGSASSYGLRYLSLVMFLGAFGVFFAL
ncbi:hypothetical protein MMC14_005763 [Varicellaria rhodocarpa]|nr:hypothetical protein [Varicellaria rhodocarpa]